MKKWDEATVTSLTGWCSRIWSLKLIKFHKIAGL